MVLDLWLLAWRAANRGVRGAREGGASGRGKAPGSRVASIAVTNGPTRHSFAPDDD